MLEYQSYFTLCIVLHTNVFRFRKVLIVSANDRENFNRHRQNNRKYVGTISVGTVEISLKMIVGDTNPRVNTE